MLLVNSHTASKVTHHNGSLPAMFFVEGDHLLKGEVTDDVTVEDKKWLVIFYKYVLG